MSILKYGSYAHALTPVVKIARQRLGQAEGAQQCERRTWTISGALIGALGSLITQIASLESAYAADGQDLTLYADDGITVLHQLLNSACLKGTKILKRPDFPRGEGAELATHRSYEIVVQGDVLAGDAPAANAWGEKTTATSTNAQGQVMIAVQGRYRGSGAQAAADAAKLASKMVESEDQDVNGDTGEVSFRYQYIDASASRSVISSVETVEYMPQHQRAVFLEVLGGGSPVKQVTVMPAARARQSGEAVGRGGYPTPPAALWPADLINEVIRKRSPRLTKDGQLTEYGVSWDYEFAFVADPSWLSPNNPPT